MEKGEAVEETPELPGLLQQDPASLRVPVRVDEAITAHVLPNRRVQYATDTVGTDFVSIAPATPKRGRGSIVAIDGDMVVNDRSTGAGMVWPERVPLEIRHSRAVFVKAVTDTVQVGSTWELWAD